MRRVTRARLFLSGAVAVFEFEVWCISLRAWWVPTFATARRVRAASACAGARSRHNLTSAFRLFAFARACASPALKQLFAFRFASFRFASFRFAALRLHCSPCPTVPFPSAPPLNLPSSSLPPTLPSPSPPSNAAPSPRLRSLCR